MEGKIKSNQKSYGRDQLNDEFLSVVIRISIVRICLREKNPECKMERILNCGENRKIIFAQFGSFRMNGFGRYE